VKGSYSTGKNATKAPARNFGADLVIATSCSNYAFGARDLAHSSKWRCCLQRNAQRLLVAMRSSIKSRSTSQNLSDESRSLSVSSTSADSSPSIISGRHASERLLDCGDLRLDFDARQRLRAGCAAPINIPPYEPFVGYFASPCEGGCGNCSVASGRIFYPN